MVGVDLVVPVRRDHEPSRVVDAPAEHPQRVQRRLVGPVDVLEDDNRGLGELVEEGAGDPTGVGSRGEQLGQSALRPRRDVRERAERRRRREVLARSLQHARRRLRDERAHERGLPDACLAAEEDEPATTCCLRGERGQQLLPFEQRRHPPMFPCRAPRFKPRRCPYAGTRAYDRRMAVDMARSSRLVERSAPPSALREVLEAGGDDLCLLALGGATDVGKNAW